MTIRHPHASPCLPDGTSWKILPLVSALTAVAALLHDLGKLSARFQDKLRGKGDIADPVRHEYISCMLLRLFVNQTGARTDKEWIDKLPSIDAAQLFSQMAGSMPLWGNKAEPENPFLDMEQFPVFLSICWLIVSHHRLPYAKGEVRAALDLDDGISWKNLAYFIYGEAGYVNATESSAAVAECQKPATDFDAPAWRKSLAGYSSELAAQIELFPKAFEKPDFLILGYSRMGLVFGDHVFSAADRQAKKGPFANTVMKNGKTYMNQSLEEHLTGVCAEAVSFINKIPKLKDLEKAYDTEWLDRRSTGRFEWQEKAADTIRAVVEKKPGGGIFVVNIAGTGTGKTLGNAKMLHAFCEEGLRGTVALGLRTLTMQTGKEYRERMGLHADDLCVAMGSSEAVELKDRLETADEDSEPEPLVDYDILDGKGTEVFSGPEEKLVSRFLGSPVLVCTIDQIIKASEPAYGGGGIIPQARIISSDLVIDEIDDYTDGSLVSVGRLVYLAAASGRNVIISSATIPPEISLNLKHYYDLGWSEHAKIHGRPDATIGLAVDEFSSSVFDSKEEYVAFCRRHAKKITEAPSSRKGEIVDIGTEGGKRGIWEFNEAIYREILVMHGRHCSRAAGKNVSFGLVRFANIRQLAGFALFLEKRNDVRIKPVVYHSRFPLADRNNIEMYLDRVLCRKNPDEAYTDPVVAAHIARAESDVIFTVLASPIEEIGRDHDFDWCVIEPSSYRSLIQTLGRIQRHRLGVPELPNVGILRYNARFLRSGRGPCFVRPGFESEKLMLGSYDMRDICDEEKLRGGMTAAQRILPLEDVEEPLARLEHEATQAWLDPDNRNPGGVAGYIDGFFLTALPKRKTPLRKNEEETRVVYKRINREMGFVSADDLKNRKEVKSALRIEMCEDLRAGWWLETDHDDVVEKAAEKMGMQKEQFENRYCTMNVPADRKFKFSEKLGLYETED